MNDKDKKAYAIYENTISHREGYLYIAREAWQAACEYKDKEIELLNNEISWLEEKIDDFMDEPDITIKKLQAENKKLREALEFYAKQSSWMGYHRDVDTIAPSDCEPAKAIEDGFDILLGGKRAREALKE